MWARVNGKIQKNIFFKYVFFLNKYWYVFDMRVDFHDGTSFVDVWGLGNNKKRDAPKRQFFVTFWSIDFVFFSHLHERDFIAKIYTNVKNASMFAVKKLDYFEKKSYSWEFLLFKLMRGLSHLQWPNDFPPPLAKGSIVLWRISLSLPRPPRWSFAQTICMPYFLFFKTFSIKQPNTFYKRKKKTEHGVPV